jgi:hypothetical protein
MSKYAMLVEDAVITFGDVASPVSVECQVTSAAITSTPNLITVPATGCEGSSQMPAASTYALALTFLQDWGQTDSLSQLLWDGEGDLSEFSIALATDPLVPVATGSVRLVAGSYGGDFSQPLSSTVTLPCQGKPVIGIAAVAAARAPVPASA